MARRAGVPVRALPPEGINAPAFVTEVQALSLDLAIVAGSVPIWGSALLASVGRAVNCHDGSLPEHAGLAATAFSIFEGDETSGFTFHDMVEEVDAGPVLVEGAVPIGPSDTVADVTRRKWAAAAAALPEVLDLVLDDAPGRPQEGETTFRTRRHRLRLTVVDDPTAVTVEDFEHRLRSFGWLDTRIGGRLEPVTAVSPRWRPWSPAIELADGRRFVTRLASHPAAPYRLVRSLVRR